MVSHNISCPLINSKFVYHIYSLLETFFNPRYTMFFINTLIIMKAHWINSNIFCQAIGVLLELTRFGGIRYHFIIYNNVSSVLHRLPLTQASCSSLTRRVKTSSPTTMDIQTVQSRVYLGLGSTRASDQKTTAICQMRTYIDMLPNDSL